LGGRFHERAPSFFHEAPIAGTRKNAPILEELLETVRLLAVLLGGGRYIRRITETFAMVEDGAPHDPAQNARQLRS
jgi:nicotinate-nucleotide pyrophosphorylase